MKSIIQILADQLMLIPTIGNNVDFIYIFLTVTIVPALVVF